MEYMNLSLSPLLPIPLELITRKTLLNVVKEVVNLYVSTTSLQFVNSKRKEFNFELVRVYILIQPLFNID